MLFAIFIKNTRASLRRERDSEAWMPERIERTIRWCRPFDRMKSIVCYMKDGIISIEKMIAARGPTINGVPVSAIALVDEAEPSP